uniref:Muscular LMNA interacting protein n=1 Tax=Salvator merianae TaxID=96440 RepID=A0A8D0DQC5_SALMN
MEEDLFKAEFVFIVDSDEDKQVAEDNGYGHENPKTLDTSSSGSTGGESRRFLNMPSLPLHYEPSSSSSNQEKEPQLTSPLPTSDHLSHKPSVPPLLSPVNLTVEHDQVPIVHQASSAQESHSQCRSVNGASVYQTATYSQSTTSYSLPSSILKRPSFLFNSPSDSAPTSKPSQPDNLHKISESSSSPSPSKSPCPSANTPLSSSPQAHSPLPAKGWTTLSVAPFYITTHLLSPSPKPLPSLHGSSTSIYSINNPGSLVSSSGNLMKSGIKSPLPTRLSLLTAILKSGSAPKRPFSPASCPATFSPCSLGSSTLTIDQKFQTTPPTPKKGASSYSARSDSPGQEDFHLSVFSNVSNYATPFTKFRPRARSLSPKRHLDTRSLSPDKLRPLSPTITSYRKTVVSPLLQPKFSDFSLPPQAPRKGALSPSPKIQGPEKSKKVHTYSPTFTAKSHPVSTPTANQKHTVSSTSEKHSVSSTFMYPSYQSKERFPQASAKEQGTFSQLSSPYWRVSNTGSNSPAPDPKVKAPSPLTNSSLVHSNFRACPPSSRPRTPTLTQPRSPTLVHPPCSLLSRSRELTSSSGSENKTHKTHKIKTSYKALAAIPTNTVLLEQKALDESTKTERTIEDEALDTHSEMCSPAQLRQQTEELCAAIDEVLQESRPMHRSNSSPSSLQTILESDPGRTSAASQRPGGRETKFANLYLSASSVTDSPKTKPGVIRPALVKAKIIVKEEEPVQPNPFKKYLEETSDSQTEEDPSFSHPFLHTKLNLPNKSPLHRQAISHADSLTASDILDNSYRLYDRSILYSKPAHPIVPIPENEALSSKEFCSARIKNKTDLPTYQEIKDLSKRKVADNGSPYNRSHCLARADLENISAKNN